jgi:hypothetical protein
MRYYLSSIGSFCCLEAFMKSPSPLTKAKYVEWQASLWGACFIAFGLGAFLANFAAPFAAIIILLGIPLHAWGMYRIHQRNNDGKR